MAISNRDIQALFMATQSAKGAEPSHYKKAAHYGSVTTDVVKEEVEVDPDLGNGYHDEESYTGSVYGTLQVDGIGTTGVALSHALSSFMERDTTAGTGGDAGSNTHVFVEYNHNPDRPWISPSIIYAPGATLGSGVVKETKLDGKATSFSWKTSPKAPPAYSLGMTYLQEGPGASGLTYEYDPEFNMPLVSNPAGTAYPSVQPSWWGAPGSVCITDKSLMWKPAIKMAGPCENGQYVDILIEKAFWEISLTMIWDNLSDQIVRYHRYLTTTPAANAKALKVGFAKGRIAWQESTLALITGTSLHESVAWDFTNVIWTEISIDSSQTPVVVKLKGKTFKNAHSITVVNGKDDTAMTF